MKPIVYAVAVLSIVSALPERAAARQRGALLERMTWQEAERALGPETVVVIPLGAAAKEHGPHLPLDNDLRIAEYLKRRVLEAAPVVVAPTIPYHYYPAFAEYPGSTSLRFETARDLVVDVCRSLARFGPRRFYVLNTGVSTKRPLEAAAEVLAAERIVLRSTDLLGLLGPVEREVSKQEGGTHADEIETSMMLYIAPETVDMKKAVKDYRPGSGPLTRVEGGPGVYSPSGVWGDATLATRKKGERVVEALVAGVLADLEALRRLPASAR
jgi:creatinine amidohydrolase